MYYSCITNSNNGVQRNITIDQVDSVFGFKVAENHLLIKPIAWCGRQWRNWARPLDELGDGKIREVLRKIGVFVPLMIATIGASFIAVFAVFCFNAAKVNNIGLSAPPHQAVIGSGNLVTKKIDLNIEQIQSLKVGFGGNVIVKKGKSNSLVVQADDNLLDILSQRVKSNQLLLGVRSNSPFMTRNQIRYELTIASPLNNLIVSGSGNIAVDEGIDVDLLNCRISGSGKITVLKGKVQRQSIQISGSGEYSALDLEAEDSNVKIIGSGKARVQASRNLFVNLSGSGSCLYSGNPTITKQIRGSGKIQRI